MCHEIFTGPATHKWVHEMIKTAANTELWQWSWYSLGHHWMLSICCFLFYPKRQPSASPQLQETSHMLLAWDTDVCWVGLMGCLWPEQGAQFGGNTPLELPELPSHPLNVSQVFWGLIFFIRWCFSPKIRVCLKKKKPFFFFWFFLCVCVVFLRMCPVAEMLKV